MARQKPSPLTVACPFCGAPPNKRCVTESLKTRAPHPSRKTAAFKVSAAPPRQQTGGKGHRLLYTSAPTREMTRKRAAVRKAQPVTVRRADGSVEVLPPRPKPKTSKRRPRKPGRNKRAVKISVQRDLAARKTTLELREEQARLKEEAAARRRAR